MPTLLLAGIPERLVRQIKAAIAHLPERIPSWAFSIATSRSKRAEIDNVEDVLTKAVGIGTCHLMGFHQTDGRTAVAEAIKPYFRFRWGDASTLWAAANDLATFSDYLELALVEEDSWRFNVAPDTYSSPLILPQRVFKALSVEHARIWSDSEFYNREEEYFPSIGRRIEQFRLAHTDKPQHGSASCFKDRANLRWKDFGPFHGKQRVEYQNFKYSHRLPDGFHYDVEHSAGLDFDLLDIDAKVNSVKSGGRVNIDCHGLKSH